MADCVNVSHPQFEKLRDTYFDRDVELTKKCILDYWAERDTTAFPTVRYINKWIMKEGPRLTNVEDVVTHTKSETEISLENASKEPAGGKPPVDDTLTHLRQQNIELTRNNIAEIIPKLAEWGESGVGITHMYDPIQGQRVFKETQASANGSIIHSMFEDVSKEVIRLQTNGEAVTFDKVRNVLDRSQTSYESRNDGKIWSIEFNDGGREKLLDSIATWITELADNHEFLASEMRVKYSNPKNNIEYRGAIDLVLKDKVTKDAYVMDFKTSADPAYANPKKWFNKSLDVNKGGESKMDKHQLQSTAYSLILNDALGGNAIAGRLVSQFTIQLENGKVSGMAPTEIDGVKQHVKGSYLLPDTPMYDQMVRSKYGMESDLEKAKAIDTTINNAVEKLQNAYARLKEAHVSKEVLNPLNFSFHEWSLQGEWSSVLSHTNKFLKKLSNDATENAHDPTIINKYNESINIIKNAFGGIHEPDFKKAVEQYAENVLGYDRAATEAFINENLNALTFLKRSIDSTSNKIIEMQSVVANEEAKKLRDFVIHQHKDFLPAYVKKIQAELKAPKITLEITKAAYERMRSEGKFAEVDGVISDLINLNNNSINAVTPNSALKWFRNNKYLRGLFSAASSESPFVQLASYDLLAAHRESTKFKKEKFVEMRGLIKELDTMFPKHPPAEKYSFMLKDKTDSEGNIVGKNVVRELNNEWYDDLKTFISDGGSINTWVKEHAVLKNIAQDESLIKRMRSDFDTLKKKGFDVPEVGEKLSDGDVSLLDTKRKLLQVLEDMQQANDLSKEEAQMSANGIANAKTLEKLRKSLESIVGKDLTNHAKARVSTNLIDLLDEVQYEHYTPKDEKYIDSQYKEIMSYGDDDPRKKFFEYYWDNVNRYDGYVSEEKRLGNELASVQRSPREGKHFWQKSNRPDRSYLEWMDSLRAKQVAAGDFFRKAPLYYSGRQLSLENQSFDLAEHVYRLSTSAQSSRVYTSALSGVDAITQQLERGMVFKPGGDIAKEYISKDLETIRKISDAMIYKTPYMQAKGVKIMNSIARFEAFTKLSGNVMSLLKSHFMTVADTWSSVYGSEEGFMGGRAHWGATAHNIRTLGGILDKNDVAGALLDSFDLKEHFSDENIFEKKHGLYDYIMKSYLLSDNYHKRMMTLTHLKSTYLLDENNNLMTLESNLTRDKDGKIALKNELVKLADGSDRYYDLSMSAEKLRAVFNRTVHATDPVNRSMAMLEADSRIITSMKSLGFASSVDAMKGHSFSISTGQETIGSTTAAANFVLNFIDNFQNGNTLSEKLGLKYTNDMKSLSVEEQIALKKFTYRTIAWAALTGATYALASIGNKEEDGFSLTRLAGYLTNSMASVTSVIGLANFMLEYCSRGSTGTITAGMKVVKDLTKDVDNEKFLKDVLHAIPYLGGMLGGGYDVIHPPKIHPKF